MKRMWISWPRERLVRAIARSVGGGAVSFHVEVGIGVEGGGHTDCEDGD